MAGKLTAVVVAQSPRIEVVDGFATAAECAHLRELAKAQQEFSIESIQYAGVACYQSAHAEVDLRHADVVLQALERRFASVWGQDGEGGGGEGRTADADDVMIARTGLWDPARHDELRAVKQLMMTQDDTTAEHPPGGTAVRVVESDDSCDSEGFRLRPMADHEDESVQARALMNLHHDHNNNKARHCTLMVYLTTLPEEACGETFFPAADARADDDVLVALDKLYRSGRYIVQHPDAGEVVPEDELEVLYECEARYHQVKHAPQSATTVEGVRRSAECAGLLLTPKEGRAVLFSHHEGGRGSMGAAWHAPCTVREHHATVGNKCDGGGKWLVTFFKVLQRQGESGTHDRDGLDCFG